MSLSEDQIHARMEVYSQINDFLDLEYGRLDVDGSISEKEQALNENEQAEFVRKKIYREAKRWFYSLTPKQKKED